ncbi:MAG: hypothetical protein ABFS32_16575 [Bacteroidota bacterium]
MSKGGEYYNLPFNAFAVAQYNPDLRLLKKLGGTSFSGTSLNLGVRYYFEERH